MAIYKMCDGQRRRDFLKIGALGGLGGLGLTLDGFMRKASAGEVNAAAKAKSAIFIYLNGGPTHMDTFDLKPDAASTYRGEFNPIKTNVPGVEISEHLPKMAKCADKYAILRGVSHTLAAHNLGTKYLNTGSRPLPSLEYPGYGAVVTKELASPPDLPPFVAIPRTSQAPGFLGIEYGPFTTNAAPRQGSPFSVRGISLGGGLTVRDLERRQSLLKDLDQTFTGVRKNEVISGLDRFSQRAYDIISSRSARDAFDISKESDKISGMFDENSFSQSCLLASRLVESGVRFVTISEGGWDTHRDNWTRLKTTLLPKLDDGLAGLFSALDAKGMLESTAVFVTGEFGRTPKINERGGRDHWPRAMFCLLGGGGMKGGQVVGASDENGMGPADEAIKPDDVAATFYSAMGINFRKEYHTSSGRPIMVVRDGEPIREVLSGGSKIARS